MNPEFYLYQVPPNLPILFPSQLKRFIGSLNAQPSRLVERHHTLAKKLLSQHIKKSPFSIVPAYNFDEFAKGILCSVCWSGFMVSGSQHKLICKKCGNVEDIGTAILRSVKELKILFPDIRISTKTIFEWCNTVKDKRTIRKVLANNYNYVSLGKYSYYEFKE